MTAIRPPTNRERAYAEMAEERSKHHRNAVLVADYRAGAPRLLIAWRYKISEGRVHQIVRRLCPDAMRPHGRPRKVRPDGL